jgi:TRAP-type C4-dicarboxylate transport system permease small subunit
MIRRLLDGLYLASGVAAAFFLFVILLLMLTLALGREVNFNIPAGDDFAAWCMAAMAFLGLAYTFKQGEMIRVGLVTDRLPPRARHVLEIMTLIFAAVLIGYFAWHAIEMTYDSWRFNDMSQGVVAVPLWIPQLGFSGGLTIFWIALVDELVHVLGGNVPRYEKPKPQTAEEVIQRAIEGGV